MALVDAGLAAASRVIAEGAEDEVRRLLEEGESAEAYREALRHVAEDVRRRGERLEDAAQRAYAAIVSYLSHPGEIEEGGGLEAARAVMAAEDGAPAITLDGGGGGGEGGAKWLVLLVVVATLLFADPGNRSVAMACAFIVSATLSLSTSPSPSAVVLAVQVPYGAARMLQDFRSGRLETVARRGGSWAMTVVNAASLLSTHIELNAAAPGVLTRAALSTARMLASIAPQREPFRRWTPTYSDELLAHLATDRLREAKTDALLLARDTLADLLPSHVDAYMRPVLDLVKEATQTAHGRIVEGDFTRPRSTTAVAEIILHCLLKTFEAAGPSVYGWAVSRALSVISRNRVAASILGASIHVIIGSLVYEHAVARDDEGMNLAIALAFITFRLARKGETETNLLGR